MNYCIIHIDDYSCTSKYRNTGSSQLSNVNENQGLKFVNSATLVPGLATQANRDNYLSLTFSSA